MHIASSIDGRLRIRDSKLSDKTTAETISGILTAIPGVSSIAVNRKTGSLLVMYSAAVAGLQTILESVSGLLGAAEVPGSGERRSAERRTTERRSGILFNSATRRNAINIGMLASLLTSMLGIMAGKKLHIAAGVVFLGALGVHLIDKRKTVLVWR